MAAFHFVMTGILIIIAAIVCAFLAVGLNPLITIHNMYVAQGTVGVQSHNLAVWALAFLVGIPGFTIIGLWIAAIIRAIEVAEGG
jgi:hypothetical protein